MKNQNNLNPDNEITELYIFCFTRKNEEMDIKSKIRFINLLGKKSI